MVIKICTSSFCIHYYLSVQADSDSEEESDGSITSPQQSLNKTTTSATSGGNAISGGQKKPTTRSASTESTASTESSSSSAAVVPSGTTGNTTNVNTTPSRASDATKQRYTSRGSDAGLTETQTTGIRSRNDTSSSVASPTTTTEKKPFQSRFLPQRNHSTPDKKEETESSTEEETSTEESEDEEEESKKITVKPISKETTAPSFRDVMDTKRTSRDESGLRSSYATPNYSDSTSKYGTTTRSRPTTSTHHDSDDHKYGSSSTGSR